LIYVNVAQPFPSDPIYSRSKAASAH
jgi:hypothetical protein